MRSTTIYLDLDIPLTDTTIRNIKAAKKVVKYTDGGGLQLHVPPSGSKLWRMAYRFNGKQKTLYIGSYPSTSLAQARSQRDSAKQKIAQNVDPAEEVRRDKIRQKFAADNTFFAVATELISKAEAEGKADATIRKKRWFLELLESDLGRLTISDITATDVIAPLKK